MRELLNLEQDDLDRVVAVHQCLDPAVLALGEALRAGLERPFAGRATVSVLSQNIRGQIDWQGTMRHRSQVPGESLKFSVREPGTAFDVAENRALVWLLAVLEQRVDEALTGVTAKAGANQPQSWAEKIRRLRSQVAAARKSPRLQGLRAEKPTALTLQALRAGRNRFYAERVPAAIEAVLRLTNPSPEELAAVLAERYFRPDDDGTLFEVAVALRLARAFGDLCSGPRRTRLLMREGRSSFARYTYADGREVSMAYQVWPDGEQTMRRRFADRHGIGKKPSTSRPDIIIFRSGEGTEPEAVILELKASYDAGYLRGGLGELLAYLADRPELWGEEPAAWLVAPASGAFQDRDPEAGFPIWILSADRVADAATDRFLATDPA